MPCKGCDKKKAKYIMPCKVCELIDGNVSKKNVYFCKECRAYICFDCDKDYVKRAKAFFKSLIA